MTTTKTIIYAALAYFAYCALKGKYRAPNSNAAYPSEAYFKSFNLPPSMT